MKTLSRRLGRLEVRLAPNQDAQGRTAADLFRERHCRRLAQERGVSFEEALQEHLAEHRAFWAGYTGARTITDILRYGRRHRTALTHQEPK